MEIWKNINGYEGIYQVSSLGRVKSFKRKKERILKFGTSAKVYSAVCLIKNGEQKLRTVHQLVAESFLGYIPNNDLGLVVDHIDNDKANNKLDNLQVITYRENNSKDRVNKTSKYTGVCWDKQYNKWRASIKIDGKQRNLGRFLSEIEAKNAYQIALNKK